MPRKQPVTTATGAVKVMQGALAGELLPPEHANLNAGAMPFWREIIRGRARQEWEAAPALLSTAASLAWTQWQAAQLRAKIETDESPDAKMVQRVSDLQRLEMGYLRVLQQHGRAVQGEARDVKKRREIAAGILADNPLDGDLLATPTVQ